MPSLRRLGRVHSAERAKDAIRAARAAGFSNLSFDLMFWLPGQSLASWLRTIDEAIELAPDHLSLYLLELYPNAPLKEAMARAQASDATRPEPGARRQPWSQTSDDEAADMYLGALERLDRAGLRAIRDLERIPIRLSEPAQRQVLAGGVVARVWVRRALDGRRCPVEQRRVDA